MIIIKTDLKTKNTAKINYYLCPKCNTTIMFNDYITTYCKECKEKIFNVEKLLNQNITTKIDYYVNETI